MKKIFPFVALCSAPFTLAATPLDQQPPAAISPLHKKIPFNAFTGKVTKNKVRIRFEPSYEGSVWKELAKNEFILILGETDDFYAVQPPEGAKGYVFRTFILDNVVEGSRVNIRSQPHLDAPVIGQLNSGDRVEGSIDPANNKWLEIKLPSTARFYIAKEFVEKVGDVNYITHMEKRRQEVASLLNQTEASTFAEFQKPFNQVNLEGAKANFEYIVNHYTDFPEAVKKAKENLVKMHENYLAKKMAFLESQAAYSSRMLEAKNKQLADELQNQKFKLATLEQQLESEHKQKQAVISEATPQHAQKPLQLPFNMAVWLPIEERLFASWSEQTGSNDPNRFYDEQKENSFILKGIIEPYNRPVKNKPGDFMLVNASSKLPISFLYSTQVNLQDLIGHEVTVRVSSRPNNHYAFPAYFVLSFE